MNTMFDVCDRFEASDINEGFIHKVDTCKYQIFKYLEMLIEQVRPL